MILSAIAAMAKNRVIGINNTLPWSIPEDMKYFKDKTNHHIMIMGRKTFDSFGGKPLANRFHIVISRNSSYQFSHENVAIVSSMEEALKKARELIPQYNEEIFVIGGGEIYRQALPLLNRIYLTVIDQEFAGDAKFPEFNTRVFRQISQVDRPGNPSFSFFLYERP